VSRPSSAQQQQPSAARIALAAGQLIASLLWQRRHVDIRDQHRHQYLLLMSHRINISNAAAAAAAANLSAISAIAAARKIGRHVA